MNVLEVYTPRQIRGVLHALGIEIESETFQDYLCYCPFHGNRNTPAFSVSRTSGKYICFSPSCGMAGNLVKLVRTITKRNEFEALRFIGKYKTSTADFESELQKSLEDRPTFTEFDSKIVERLSDQMFQLPEGREYLNGRGLDNSTISHFNLGYSQKQGMVTVPVHSPDGLLIGMVGRSIKDKSFMNTPRLPKTKTLFNVHRAKRASATAIVTEASFDAMRIHQAGYPGAVAILGGTLSPEQKYLLNRFFSRIIIFTDFDDKTLHPPKRGGCRRHGLSCVGDNPGRDLGDSIADAFPMKEILWASYDAGMVYPHDAKDASDLTDDEITQCLVNAVPTFEYRDWGLY